MIIRRKPGKTVYWGEALDPDDLANSASGWAKTLSLEDRSAVVQYEDATRRVSLGDRMQVGPVVLTLEAIARGEAHWGIRAPREIRILRDDAKRK